MSQSSFSTIATDDRSASVDSLNAATAKILFTKTGSMVMSMSLAQFYGKDGPDADNDDFGEDNPFVRDYGLDNKQRLDVRKVAIEEAAKVAKSKRPGLGDKQSSSTRSLLGDKQSSSTRSLLGERQSSNRNGLGEKQLSNRPGLEEKQLSNTQFTATSHRLEYIKRQDASTKAFQPAILQALAEKQVDEADESVKIQPRKSNLAPPERRRSLWGALKTAILGPKKLKATNKDRPLIPPRRQEEFMGW